jgi:hypothetical protein
MMMAPDSTPDRPELNATAVDALRSALEQYLEDARETAVQPALRRIAAEAREKQVHAEQLLVLLKHVWFGLPQVARLPETEHQTRLLQRVVTLCIREYYSS